MKAPGGTENLPLRGVESWRRGQFLPDSAATMAAGRELASHLGPDSVVTLEGPMGAGTTTFAQGLAAALGVTQAVSSPTFQLYHLYPGRWQVVHLDAFRLQRPEEAEGLLLEEVLQSPWCLVMEWPERLPAAWSRDAWALRLTPEAEGRRLTLLRAPGDREAAGQPHP